MWELIAANKRRSIFVFIAMLLILLLLGGVIGMSADQQLQKEGYFIFLGPVIALFLWMALSSVSYFFGDRIILSVSRATQVTPEFYPRLYNVVEEMKIAANLPNMPEVYIVDDDSMNAFATGIHPKKSAIVVTAGLAEGLNRNELQGVVAHEMGHIVNRDVMFMTFAGVLLGTVSLIANLYLRGLLFGSSSRKSKLKSPAPSHPALLILSIILAVLAPMLVRIFYFALSRKREFLADATAVRLTRYPEGLASALEKIGASTTPPSEGTNRITAPMYIVNPFRGEMFLTQSTHPPLHVRIGILRALQNGVGYTEYQKAFRKVTGKYTDNLVPSSALREKSAIPIVKPEAEDEKPVSHKRQVRKVTDLILAANGFMFLPCDCGLKMKVPPTLGSEEITCPRCGRHLMVPSITSDKSYTEKLSVDDATFSYRRKGKSWESFLCKCGNTVQLSPLFKSSYIKCRACGRKIEIKSGQE